MVPTVGEKSQKRIFLKFKIGHLLFFYDQCQSSLLNQKIIKITNWKEKKTTTTLVHILVNILTAI